MLKTRGYATKGPTAALEPFTFERREPREHDVVIEILYSGICHSDIHQARNEWEGSTYPMVPGHEILGRVVKVGGAVTKLRVGELAGVGCMVDSCRACGNCQEGYEQYCERHTSWTYNGTEQDQTTPTYGGYSTHIVVDERFALRIPDGLDPAGAAPLLCAGITTYAPLKRWGAGRGKRVGVVGLGGLGHMAVKLAVAMGAEVTVFTTSAEKQRDAERLGATRVVLTREPGALEAAPADLDIIIDAVSAPHDVDAYLQRLRRDGVLVLVGLPEKPLSVEPFSVVDKQRALAGSNIGGIAATQEMLELCARHGIVADVEVISAEQINEAYERAVAGKVKYRFVIDAKTF